MEPLFFERGLHDDLDHLSFGWWYARVDGHQAAESEAEKRIIDNLKETLRGMQESADSKAAAEHMRVITIFLSAEAPNDESRVRSLVAARKIKFSNFLLKAGVPSWRIVNIPLCPSLYQSLS